MTGLTDRMRADFRTMRAIAERTRMGPADRVRSIRQLMGRLMGSNDVQEQLNKFQVGYLIRVGISNL
jgi:aubergine-like protein